MAKKTLSKKFLFVDTNIFIDALTSNHGEQVIDELAKKLTESKIVLILPEVIKMEIITQYSSWEKDILEKAEENLSVESILGIRDTTGNGKKKERRGETEAKKIDDIISPDRKRLLEKIKGHYKVVSDDIEKVFGHKNTKVIDLTDQLLFAGMKRSLLKKSPYTRSDKATENAHTKDMDCIAFESLLSFISLQDEKKSKGNLVMCVSDKDYVSKSGDLHDDLKRDIGKFSKYSRYGSLIDMLKGEFKVEIGSKNKNVPTAREEGFTLSPKTGVVDSSADALDQNRLTSNL